MELLNSWSGPVDQRNDSERENPTGLRLDSSTAHDDTRRASHKQARNGTRPTDAVVDCAGASTHSKRLPHVNSTRQGSRPPIAEAIVSRQREDHMAKKRARGRTKAGRGKSSTVPPSRRICNIVASKGTEKDWRFRD